MKDVMARLDPAIQASAQLERRPWMAATSPAMTLDNQELQTQIEGEGALGHGRAGHQKS